ncbi:phosphopentomutase [Haloferula rosea]|uniref:Phosphopentomutase n=1 Tax=Haloferula rosea TaxID=490093 RepID=A0A934R8V4_9BACT|nr:phosphopentomutase [Haloferula rosea]MBK1826447.1 phosphopentomutase [Haloferula rosea]
MRALCILLDSVGCGHAPDAVTFGDEGADTLGHLYERIPGFELPTLASLGLHEVLRSLNPASPASTVPTHPNAGFCHLTERSAGKDTTTGHWELMGAVNDEPFATFKSFPEELVRELECRGRCHFIGNEAASGTEIIHRLGGEHCASGRPILYTSADSVLQIAAHENPAVFGLDRLLELCRTSRELLDERGIRIGRVIARPFVGGTPETFQRTSNRHDYSLMPPPTVLNRLSDAGVKTIGIGKISDIFAGSGIDESHPTRSNADGMATIERIWDEHDGSPQFIFANLVDFDMLYGHRRDPEGYATALHEFDAWLSGFLPKVGADFLMITADHGNDPYFTGTDHTRERVPLLTLNAPENPTTCTFHEVADLLRAHFHEIYHTSASQTVAAGSTPA